jgi:hypothetical protein
MITVGIDDSGSDALPFICVGPGVSMVDQEARYG